MKKTIFAEATLLAILSMLLLLLVNPLHLMMKIMLSMGVIAAFVILYLIKFFIIWREKPQDERDLEHRFKSSWASYSTVSALLFVGVIVEAFQGAVDTW